MSVQRTKCAFCDLPDRWPDRCPTEDCMEAVLMSHALDDHRRCRKQDCVWAEQLLDVVLALGVAACEQAGKRFAVVSTVEDGDPVVLRTFDRLQQAKPFRTKYGKRAGLDWGQTHGLVPVVRDDGFLV